MSEVGPWTRSFQMKNMRREAFQKKKKRCSAWSHCSGYLVLSHVEEEEFAFRCCRGFGRTHKVKLAVPQLVITCISVTAFADLNRSRQGHPIGREHSLALLHPKTNIWMTGCWITAAVAPYRWLKPAMSHITSRLLIPPPPPLPSPQPTLHSEWHHRQSILYVLSTMLICLRIVCLH